MNLASMIKGNTSQVENMEAMDVIESVEMSDILADAREAEELGRVSVEAIDYVDSLENFKTNIDEAIATGEVSNEATKWISLHADLLAQKIGGAFEKASVENFSSPSTNVEILEEVSTESGGIIRQVIDKIIEMIKNISNAIKKMWIKITDRAKIVRNRAENVKKKAGQLKGTAENDTFEMGGLSNLHLGGKVPTPVQANDSLDELKEVVFKYSSEKETVNMFKEVADHLKIKPTELTARKVNDFIKNNFSNTGKGFLISNAMNNHNIADISTKTGDTYQKDAFGRYTNELLGGTFIYGVVDRPSVNSEDTTIKIRFRFAEHSFNKDVEVDSKGEFNTLKGSEIQNMADIIIKMMDAMHQFNISFKDRDAAKDKLVKALDKFKKESEKSKDITPEDSRAHNNYMSFISLMTGVSDNPARVIGPRALTMSNGVLNWCERSMSQYKDN